MSPFAWLAACVGGSTAGPLVPPDVTPPPVADPAPVPSPDKALEVLPFDAAALPGPLAVDVVGGLRFRDGNGDNAFVLSRSAMADLKAVHVVLEDGKVAATKRRVVQPGEPCDVDYSAAFVPGATGVTDLDGDGLGEITFAYKYACRGDVSPQIYKLLVIEDGEKAILRGAEIISYRGPDGEVRDGDGTFTPEGFSGHPAWLAHAKTVWAAHAETRLGE